jgi:hypothetical protein
MPSEYGSNKRRVPSRKKWGQYKTRGAFLHATYPHLYGADGRKIKNPAKRVVLKNFTGTITKNPNGTVSIKGRKK